MTTQSCQRPERDRARTTTILRWTLAIGLTLTVLTAAIVTWTWDPGPPALATGDVAVTARDAPTRLVSAVPGAPDLALEDLAGRGVLLNFWATWCEPCQKELPLLVRLHERYSGAHFAVVTVTDDDPAAIRAQLAAHPLPFPVLLDPESRLRTLYGADALPYTVFIGPDGKVAGKKVGQLREMAAVQAVERLIAAARAEARKTPR